jgi:hypothetical protein
LASFQQFEQGAIHDNQPRTAQTELPEAQRIVRVAFGTFHGAPDPEQFFIYVWLIPSQAHRRCRRGKR